VRKALVVAPHPDDETLGCGGTILRHRAEGDDVAWLIVTAMTAETGFSDQTRAIRAAEIQAVAAHYDFSSVYNSALPTTRLDAMPLGDIIAAISGVVAEYAPEIAYLPHPGDVHSDHTVTFNACAACLKWTKAPSVIRVAAYETLSETDLSFSDHHGSFRANRFVEISGHLDGKIAAMGMYASELGTFPFPRSEAAIRAQAALRGAQAGFAAAEAFMVLSERY
jgi:N-acetylglucosamine malate deacetylase 1